MSNEPLVTVAMVTYNFRNYICKAIESVLCQSYTNFELIIYDDCSTDNTWELIQQYKDPRIRLYRNEINCGEYITRNKAIELAQGEYFIFIDGDDIIYPHGLEFMVTMLSTFPDSGMAIAKYYNARILYPVELTSNQVYSIEYLNEGVINVSFASTFFRTSALRSVGGLSNKYRTGDTFVRLKMCMHFNCLLISHSVTWHRETPGQASVTTGKRLGIAESVKIKTHFLNHQYCPLTEAFKYANCRFLNSSQPIT